MTGPASPDIAGFHESMKSESRRVEQITRLSPFHFRGKNVDIQRVAIVQGQLEPNRSPIPQRTNTVYSAYNQDNPLEVYGQIRGELKNDPQGKTLSLTWIERQHPARGVVRQMLRELAERGEVQTINTEGEQLTKDSQHMAEILEREAKDPSANFTIDVTRQEIEGRQVITGFSLHHKTR